ncbi:MAG: hypothetical protein AVO34_12435 [Firmicutes bacterium ML8_F2]|jgi:hypothetical protein|nr:MAG: hypothetical protein AVO34_12435 [Firmicutes bacterium ML8_F2]
MGFWDWMNKVIYNNENDNGFRYVMFCVVLLLFFLIIPGTLYYLSIFYFLAKWAPTVGDAGFGGPRALSIIIVFSLYYFGVYYSYKWHKTKRRLNDILDMLLDENEVEYLLTTAESLRRYGGLHGDKGEERARFFVE